MSFKFCFFFHPQAVKDDVRLKGASVQTALATLSTIALLRSKEFHAKLKALVPTIVVKNILLSDEVKEKNILRFLIILRKFFVSI